jgi:hypothetical protein
MPTTPSHLHLVAPVLGFAIVGFLVLVLRWAFRRGSSLVAAPARPGQPDDYGMLVEVAAPRSLARAVDLAEELAAIGLHATYASTTAGPRVFVWPADEARARALLDRTSG